MEENHMNALKILHTIAGVGIIIALIVIPYLYFRETRTCLRGYQEEYMTKSWTQFMMVGGIMTQIYHPSVRSTRFVCEEWQEELK